MREAQEKLAEFAQELAQLKRLVFGTKRERFEPVAADQLALFAGAAPIEAPALAYRSLGRALATADRRPSPRASRSARCFLRTCR